MIIEDCPNFGTNWDSPQSIEGAKVVVASTTDSIDKKDQISMSLSRSQPVKTRDLPATHSPTSSEFRSSYMLPKNINIFYQNR